MELVKQIMLYPLKFNVDITKKEIALYVLVCNDLQYILSGKNRVQKIVLHATFISKRFHRHIYLCLYRHFWKHTPDLKIVVTFGGRDEESK